MHDADVKVNRRRIEELLGVSDFRKIIEGRVGGGGGSQDFLVKMGFGNLYRVLSIERGEALFFISDA